MPKPPCTKCVELGIDPPKLSRGSQKLCRASKNVLK